MEKRKKMRGGNIIIIIRRFRILYMQNMSMLTFFNYYDVDEDDIVGDGW